MGKGTKLEIELNAKITELEKLDAESQDVIAGMSQQLDKVTVEAVEAKEKIEVLEKKIESLGKDNKLQKNSTVITDIKKLVKGKKYVTGPTGSGFVEA